MGRKGVSRHLTTPGGAILEEHDTGGRMVVRAVGGWRDGYGAMREGWGGRRRARRGGRGAQVILCFQVILSSLESHLHPKL